MTRTESTVLAAALGLWLELWVLIALGMWLPRPALWSWDAVGWLVAGQVVFRVGYHIARRVLKDF